MFLTNPMENRQTARFLTSKFKFAKNTCFWQTPMENRQTARFLTSIEMAAFLQHYNRFTTGVAHAARKIRDCTMPEEQIKNILENVKRKLLDSPALKSANFKNPLYIYSDASDLDVAGVIYQKNKNGGFDLVTCFSKKLPKSMINKSIYCKAGWQ